MDRLRSPDDTRWSDLPPLAAVIFNSSAGQRHVGVLVLWEGKHYMLHQANHVRTQFDEWSPRRARGRAWAEVRLGDHLVEMFAGTCDIVQKRYAWPRRGLPYGVRYEGAYFERTTGELHLLSPAGHGLTCATFVLALFETIGLELLKLDTWPEREDDSRWHGVIVDAIRQCIQRSDSTPEDRAHPGLVADEAPCARFRPEEVVAGVLRIESCPVAFEVAAALGVAIVGRLPPSPP